MGLLAILVALGLLIFLAYRGWSILLLAPAAALIAAGLSGQPLLAHWTQTFMASAAQFIMQFFRHCHIKRLYYPLLTREMRPDSINSKG